MTEEEKLTRKQQKALHKLYQIVADGFNEEGQTVQMVLAKMAEVTWTKVLVKELWKQFQFKMLQKKSTKDLTTTDIDIVFASFSKFVAENSLAVEFPSIQQIMLQNLTKNYEELANGNR